jgi:hypothetical protein
MLPVTISTKAAPAATTSCSGINRMGLVLAEGVPIIMGRTSRRRRLMALAQG